MSEINCWSEVPDGSIVIEDTYNEVYEVFTRDGEQWIRQIGWQLSRTQKPIPENNERPLDFEPNCMYDQPWYWLKNAKAADYSGSVSSFRNHLQHYPGPTISIDLNALKNIPDLFKE